MRREFRPRFTSVVVALLTIALGVMAWINFDQQRKYRPPDDGVTWKDSGNGVSAGYVRTGSPAARAGVRAGDIMVSVNGVSITKAPGVTRELYRIGAYATAEYALLRQGHGIQAVVIPEPHDNTSPIRDYLYLVALLYLGMGVFVVLRRSQAPRALHFYLFCLASFVLLFFHHTGKLNPFDWTVYWLNVVATVLMPALLVHFALVFPDPRPWLKRPGAAVRLIYGSAALLVLVHAAVFASVLQVRAPGLTVNTWLDRLEYLYLAALLVAATAVFYSTYRQAETPLLRQQMKWITRGMALGVGPFAVFYALPFLFGATPTGWMQASALPLLLVPLTFGYAIVRYRLMDVDILFRRGAAYTLATVILVAIYFTTIALVGSFFTSSVPATGTTGLIIAVVVSAFLFRPLQAQIQDRLDRYFYGEGYDYRRTLIEFGRDLSTQTDLEAMLGMVVERLSTTLTVDKVAIFLADWDGRAQLARSRGISFAGELDLSFLDTDRPEFASGCLFIENTRQAPGQNQAARRVIAALDLHYYVACRAQGRTVAFLGLGQTAENDYLSSEDVALVETLAGYLGAAVENARLYERLKRKMAEYERLKDFNENIVESINMGILALDLEDRIESWNTQIELMYGLSRDEAYGQPIDKVFPAELVADLIRLRQDDGIHNLYKHRVHTSSGEERVLNIAVAPLVSKTFELIGRLVIFDDITEQVALEQQLAQAEKLSSIGLLAAGVAHEVNTPLAVISSYAQMLAKQMPPEDPRWKLLDKIAKSTFRASEIVNNLLNFSRTGNAEMAPVELNKVIGDTLALLEHHFRTSRVRVETELSDEAPMLKGNEGKLQQVFLNLFLNARDAMPDGGVLRVRSRVDGPAVRIEISDSGEGIAHEHLSRIYDPFFTTKPATAKSAPPGEGNGNGLRSGSGLGLSVTYGIVQEHAGKIRVESTPQRGTSFFLEFPRLRKVVTV
jgi:PAS domain S-box-containing protein